MLCIAVRCESLALRVSQSLCLKSKCSTVRCYAGAVRERVYEYSAVSPELGQGKSLADESHSLPLLHALSYRSWFIANLGAMK